MTVLGCERSRKEEEGLYQLSLLGVDECPRPPGADPKKRTIGVKVKLLSHASGGLPANFFYASLVSHTGARYLAEPEGCEPLLSGRPLRDGEAKEGYLNFPVPTEQTASKVLYLPPIAENQERDRVRELMLSSTEPVASAAGSADPNDEFGEITEDE